MVIDSSALIAVVRREPEGEGFLRIMREAFPLRVAASTVVETSVVILSRFGEAGLSDLESVLIDTSVEIMPFTGVQAKLAIDAFRRYGKGRHPAGLNFGDCLSYALAKATGEPLLFKGDDFSQTDIKRAA
jgi:ribonuclease VapC